MLKPLVTQVWPQFTADEQFTASFSNVFVERVELFRSARKVIICLRSTEPLDSALCGRLLASLEPHHKTVLSKSNRLGFIQKAVDRHPLLFELFDHSLDGFRRDGVIVEVVAHGQLITGKNLLQ